MAVDSRGNLFVSDGRAGHILRLTPGGVLSIAAGNGLVDFRLAPAGEGGPARNVPLYPGLIAFDSNDTLYLVERTSVRKINALGIITTVARYLDQPNLDPRGIGLDASGNLYVGELSGRVVRISPAGAVTSIAGPDPSIADFGGLAVDPAGNVFVSSERIISRITPSGGIIRLLDRTAPPGNRGAFPIAIAVDRLGGGILAADPFDNTVLRITADGAATRIAGIAGVRGYSGDAGPATQATLSDPYGVAADLNGNVFISDRLNRRIRRIGPNGVISTVAGNGRFRFGGDGGPAISAVFDRPLALAFDSAGSLFVTDHGNQRIRKITTSGVINTFAADLVSPSFSDLADLAIDAQDNVFAPVDGIRKFSPSGVPAVVSTALSSGLTVEPSGSILASALNKILRLTPAGSFTVLAGTGDYSISGDGGPAVAAQLLNPGPLRLDRAGNLYFIDDNNQRIRMVTSGGTIRTFAGPGSGLGFGGDGGPATAAQLTNLAGMAVDDAGNVYFSQGTFGGHRIRRVGVDGIVRLVAGGGSPFEGGFLGDGGPAAQAALGGPAGMALDRRGNLYFADSVNHRIRVVLADRPVFAPVPQQMDFAATSNGPTPKPQSFVVSADVVGIAIVNQPETRSGGGWLSVTPVVGATPRVVEVRADPTNVPPGTHAGVIRVRLPDATPVQREILVTFTVGAALPPKLEVDARSFSFTYPQQGTARSETFKVFNTGGVSLPFQVDARTDGGGNWLSASPLVGTATPLAPVTVAATANPAGIPVGTYTGRITVTAANGEVIAIAVTMTVNNLDQAMLLSQTGLSFTAVESGGVLPPQSFGVLNLGRGAMSWTVSTSTLAGGAWLSATPNAGASTAAQSAPLVEVRVNAASLAAGVYHGLVRVEAPAAANAPQFVSVTLEVLRAGSTPPAIVVPTELVFQAAEGTTPASQEVLVYNIDRSARTFRTLRSVATNMFWFSVLPETGTLDPNAPARIVVQPTAQNLGRGITRGTLSFQFSDGRVSEVAILFVVSPRAPASAAARQAAGCTPTRLLPTLMTLGSGFAVSAGFPVGLVANVTNDCGDPFESGSVVVEFSNGDAPVVLSSVRGGRWDGTWHTRRQTSDVSIKLRAADQVTQISGIREIDGALRSPQDTPVIGPDAVVSAAGLEPYTALAPGGFISLFGDRLSEGQNAAEGLPLPTTLGGASVVIAGRTMPLQFASGGQINAIVPHGININTRHQILIRRGNTYSRPIAVDVAAAQPAVFLAPQPQASRQGHIYRVDGAGNLVLASPATPATAGDVLVLYCAGLGAVNPPVDAGAPGPAREPLARTVNPVSVTIGGAAARVLFAGLAPGFPAVYQVNVLAPDEGPFGNALAVVIRTAEQQSPAVTMAIR